MHYSGRREKKGMRTRVAEAGPIVYASATLSVAVARITGKTLRRFVNLL